jgi:protein YibB
MTLADDDISIVTAFFDIGRGDWTEDKGFPAYVPRSTDIYIERFGYLATLKNEMVIYTSPDLAPRVAELRRGKENKTTIIPLPLASIFPERRAAIQRVQNDPAYKLKIDPAMLRNPEYFSPDYVLVTNLKAYFTAHAVQNNLVHNRQVAWLDFGYCRSMASLGGSTHWRYAFTSGKIHYFTFGDYVEGFPISEIVYKNIVLVCGAAVVAEKHLWPVLAQLMNKAADDLLQNNLVDDDQTLFLMASLYQPHLFETHKISDSDWQPVLRLFNKEAKG